MSWLASPLAGTLAVVAGLGLLSVPLRSLTSRQPVVADVPPAPALQTDIHAVLRLRLLTAASHVTVKSAAGKTLLEKSAVPAGESEDDAVIPFDGMNAELSIRAEFPDGTGETAVFLTVMPDGREDQTRYAIGEGGIDESLHFEWKAP